MRLIVANINLVTSIAGGDTIWEFHSFHDAELVQNRPSLLTEDDHSLHLAFYNDDVAKPVDSHATWVLQNVRAELAYESTITCEDLHL